MGNWEIQCSNCSQIFDAEKAIWCKCSYQYPTKICPYCLKCNCEPKEAFFDFWRNMPKSQKNESNYIIRRSQLPGWLERAGILNHDDTKDILEEAKASKISFLRAAFRLGYLDKQEILQLKRLTAQTPAELLKGAMQSSQSNEIWSNYGGIIIDKLSFNRQLYNVVAFPFGASTSGITKVQELLKTFVISIFIELRIWKLIADSICLTQSKAEKNDSFSYSIKEWLEKLLDEIIALGQEEILIEGEPHFQKKSNIYIYRNNSWLLHSIAPVDYDSLEWSLKNAISQEGRKYKNNYFLRQTNVHKKLLVTIKPDNWYLLHSDDQGFKCIVQKMNLKSGLLVIRTYGDAYVVGRALVKLAEMSRYSIAINKSSLSSDNVALCEDADKINFGSFFKYVFVVKDRRDFQIAKRLSLLNFVIALIEVNSNLREEEVENFNFLDDFYFWRLRMICGRCKNKVEIDGENDSIQLWERNEDGCPACEHKGYVGEKIIFVNRKDNIKELFMGLLNSEDYDWKDLSFYQPKIIYDLL